METVKNASLDITDQLNASDLSVVGGIGFDLPFGLNGGGRYAGGLVNIDNPAERMKARISHCRFMSVIDFNKQCDSGFLNANKPGLLFEYAPAYETGIIGRNYYFIYLPLKLKTDIMKINFK